MKIGHTFKFKHSIMDCEVRVSVDEDADINVVFDSFEKYLIACGFAQKNIDNYFKEQGA